MSAFRPWLLFIAVTAIVAGAACSDEFGNKLSGFDTDDSEQSLDDALTGQAFLDVESEHSFIRVQAEEGGFSVLTNSNGLFRLPQDLSEGEWEITASYPYFHPVSQAFSVSRGLPTKPLEGMVLPRAVEFSITTNGSFFTRDSTLTITLAAENVSTEPVILSSSRSPMAAYALRLDGVTLAGGLFPGNTDEAQDVLLAPSETKYFELNVVIPADLPAGDYLFYAILTTDLTHPEYFDPSEGTASAFNESLYAKLDSAAIRIN
ncbi:MAG: carboxypeptidase-like regulatory domain-containing protein [Deltaproteobacteria bacterium]|nr:carboxypeptidase-like regulatory domain-containing protein [Deltaproteobacteria bacterium]